jgi:hypothetical protein
MRKNYISNKHRSHDCYIIKKVQTNKNFKCNPISKAQYTNHLVSNGYLLKLIFTDTSYLGERIYYNNLKES